MSMTNEQIQALKDNKVSDPYYLVECCNCGEMYPSNKLSGGWQIADTGDYGDCYCPHCDASEDYEDLGNSAAEAWNYQQKQIDALLAEREADKALIAELKEDVAKANARNDEKCSLLINQDEEIATLRQCVTELEESKTNLAILYDTNLCDMLPGPQYMDPPDGGQVEPIEQVSRMVADYRQLIAEQAKRIAELGASHKNLRESMAAIHNTIQSRGAYTSLAVILNASKRAYEESAAAAGITLVVEE